MVEQREKHERTERAQGPSSRTRRVVQLWHHESRARKNSMNERASMGRYACGREGNVLRLGLWAVGTLRGGLSEAHTHGCFHDHPSSREKCWPLLTAASTQSP